MSHVRLCDIEVWVGGGSRRFRVLDDDSEVSAGLGGGDWVALHSTNLWTIIGLVRLPMMPFVKGIRLRGTAGRKGVKTTHEIRRATIIPKSATLD